MNKIMHGVDWFYEIDLPRQFGAEHSLGSVLGRAKYSDGLFVYQGTTVGGSPGKDGILCYPKLGEHVVLFANSFILGNCNIGSHVMLSAGSQVINQDIPDNAIVFGCFPQFEIPVKDQSDMKERTAWFCLRAKTYKSCNVNHENE